ncbi:MAG: transposase [Abditibacteriota bacterium]|nr:transposase [Abditibacteriota bacterium]
MSKYVEVEKLVKSLEAKISSDSASSPNSDFRIGFRAGIQSALQTLRDESSVNSVEIAHVRCPHQTRAHWIPFTPYSSECSNCGETVSNERRWEKMYCPKCGAKMDVEEVSG